MANQLAPEKVGEKIVEWHSCIISKDIESAKAAREQTIIAVEKMKPDDKMLAYYQLISFKHDLLVSYPDKEKLDPPPLDEVVVERDDYLNFMYYYVTGQNEYLNQRYKSAIRTYKVAERLLEKVNDPSEKAEFYQKLGISYYRIDQYLFASSYIEQALEFFERSSVYKLQEITCKMVLAVIATELNCFESAETRYNELLEMTKPYPYQYALTQHNIGLNRIIQEQYEEAIDCFNMALTIPEFIQSVTALKTSYYLLNLKMRLGTYSHGLDELEKQVKEYNLPEFIARCKISRGLYLEEASAIVESGIDLLKRNEQYYVCTEVFEEISKFFESKGDVMLALEYSKLANQMSKKQTFIGVNQS